MELLHEKLQTFNRVQNDGQYDNLDLTVHRPLMAFMGHTVNATVSFADNPKEEGKARTLIENEVSATSRKCSITLRH